MSRSLYENHWGSPALTLLNLIGVLGVLNVLHVLNVLLGRIVGLLGLVLFCSIFARCSFVISLSRSLSL